MLNDSRIGNSMTIRATFLEKDGSKLVMLFGNSYKKWHDQFVEFTFTRYGNPHHGWVYDDVVGRLLKLERSHNNWPQNGLKWVSEDIFQTELDNDSKNPRSYSLYIFEEISINIALKHLKKY